jgi:hypothetical protein
MSLQDGFYLTTNDVEQPGDPEIEVEIGAFLDGKPLDNAVVTPFTAEGKLLFFKITVADTDRDTSRSGFQPGMGKASMTTRDPSFSSASSFDRRA